MAGLTPYLLFPGTAREALTFYAGVFGGTANLHSYSEFGRTDGPADAIAHGFMTDAPIDFLCADAAEGEKSFSTDGWMLSLLGTAGSTVLRQWFAALSEGGAIDEELKKQDWGAWDGQVTDRFGLKWLVGFEVED